ncbi:MAG: phage regulatory protein/antirepressor Ant [Prevotella sp.]|nr:phage regulatory protein/antirepressor Ant [Prevotella sp.]
MERELIQFGESQQTMSSLEIAKLTGKPHNDVMKAIRKMEPAWEKVHEGKFSLMYREVEIGNGAKRQDPYYELTKTECLYVATKFNDEARAKLVIRWEELEKQARTNMVALPNFEDPAEAAMAWAKEYREKKVLALENQTLQREKAILQDENFQLEAENQELKGDHNYLDLIMRSRSTLTVTQIAQDYGMSAKAMNNILAEMGIQYKNNGQWILYSQYKDGGYVSSRSIDITRSNGMPDTVLHTEWTQAGRRFLYEELKKRGIIPMLERS